MFHVLNLAAVVVQFAVAWHLWRTKLLSKFPFLACHVAANALWIASALLLDRRTRAYAIIWAVGAVMTTCSLAAAFFETIFRSLEHYPGISTRVVLGACGIIAAVSAVLGALEPAFRMIRVLLVVQRVSGVAVAVGGIALALVLNYLDPRRRPNVIRHERIMAAMAAATALAAWLNNHNYLQLGTILLAAGSILFPALWIWALTPEGEIDPRPPADWSKREKLPLNYASITTSE